MRASLVTILCMLGVTVCIDIVLRIFKIRVSWWNGTFRPSRPEERAKHDDDVDSQPKAPPAP